MPEILQRDLPIMQQRAMFAPETVNEQERTVEVIVATETPVRTFSWEDGRVNEILVMDTGAIRMERLNNGAPLLNNHSRYDLNDVLGVVVSGSARIQNRQLRATVRFPKAEDDPEADKVFRKVKDGIIRNISVGYRVHKYTVTKREGDLPEYRADDWEPTEVSLVPVPADPKAGVRSDTELFQVRIESSTPKNSNPQYTMNIEQIRAEIARLEALATRSEAEDTQLSDLKRKLEEAERAAPKPAAAPAAPAPAPAAAAPAPVDTEAVRAEERNRINTITELARAAKLDDKFIQKHVNDGTSVAKVRELIVDEWIKKGPNVDGNVSVRADETDKFRGAVADGLILRSAQVEQKKFTPEQIAAAREFRGRTLYALAEDCLIRAGVDTRGMDKMEIAKRAITSSSSDFAVILEDVNRRILLANYEATADTWRRWCAVGSVSDFREHKRLRLGSFSRLDKLQENSEYKNKPIPDAEFEKIAAETFGNTINVSRKMIVNDDLNAFARLAAMLGRAAARSIEIDAYALLISNPTLQDGFALFSAEHANIGTASVLGVTGLDADATLMSKQKDPSGNDFLDINPSILLVPRELRGTANVLNDSQYDPDANNKLQRPNIVRGLFSDIVATPRLTGTTRYLFADPSVEPVIEVAFLDGVQTPVMETEMGFDQDGQRWKIRMDYGVGAIGWRGVVRNAGTI